MTPTPTTCACENPNHNHSAIYAIDPRGCPDCLTAHPIQKCPAIRALLFEPLVYRCNDCGDPIDYDGTCGACMEYEASEQLTADRAIVGNMVRDAFGISIELRAGCTQSSLERVEIDGELIPF